MRFEVYGAKDLDGWRAALGRFPDERLDIYYTPEYYLTWVEHEAAEPHCIYAEVEGVRFLYPFFRKRIDGVLPDEGLYDIFTAYGYGGVVTGAPGAPGRARAAFNRLVDSWCRENGVVAEFIRENPAIGDGGEFVRDAERAAVRKNVYARLGERYWIQSQGALKGIKRAEKNGLAVEIDSEQSTMREFIRLYALTAGRLGMDKYYRFADGYFHNLKRHLPSNAKLINVTLEGRVVAACVFLHYADKAIYHLSASDFEYKSLCPNDLLFKGMIGHAEALGKGLLSFGGGTTKDDGDSLFVFKRKFGNVIRDVYISKKVHDEGAYARLCGAWQERYPHLAEKYGGYFLKYRLTA